MTFDLAAPAILRLGVMEDRDKRYDRQLRLWGDHGQAALERARVCLINATSTGSEILKNLVLPGVGCFTIIDSVKVTASDIGTNFFLTGKSVGSSRAKCCAHFLQKLNNVKVEYIEEDVEEILNSNPTFLCKFTIVIANSLPEMTLSRVSKILWSSSIPLLVSKAYGLLGFIRIALPRHHIIESHPDNCHEDLRLDCPFPGLVKYMESVDLSKLDNAEHSNIPYLVVLYKYLQQWQSNHNGLMPQTYREKLSLKECIRNGIRCNEAGVPLDEENFEEAIQNVNRVVLKYQIPLSVHDILENSYCSSASAGASKFWLLVRALKEFVATEGQGKLPLRGSIPDMTSNSKMYVDLCKVYQSKAEEDMEAVRSHLSQILVGQGKPLNYISEDEIRLFCRSCEFLRDLKYRSIAEELEMPDNITLISHLENSESDLVYYVLLRSAEKFFEMYHFYPGDSADGIETDVLKLRSISTSLLQKWQIPTCQINDDHITEFCRYGASEIHSVAAFIGGVAAQEVIKIITRQFVPLNNTWIYNAASQTTLTVTL